MHRHDLDTLIQKFTAGDRGFGIVAPLNEAAWACFHDPWETKPVFREPEKPTLPLEDEGPRPGQPAGSDVGLMTERLAAYLEVHHWDYALVRPGAYRCTPALTGMEGPDLTLRLALEAPRDARYLRCSLASSWVIPEPALARVRSFSDGWNQSGRGLCLLLESSAEGGMVMVLHATLPLPPKTPMRGLVAFLDGFLADARDFWARAREEAKGWPA